MTTPRAITSKKSRATAKKLQSEECVIKVSQSEKTEIVKQSSAKRKRSKVKNDSNDSLPLDEVDESLLARATLIQQILDRLYPDPPVPLNHNDPFTLLCAVILSAQTTDGKVNEVTEELFKRCPTPQIMSSMSQDQVLSMIKCVGLANTKARHLIAMAQQLCTRFNGVVPDNLVDLESLPGVGRKTASVLMCSVFNTPAFPVDTHIHRLAVRWRLSSNRNSNPERVERDLKRLFLPEHYSKLHLQMIYFGREYCQAKNHSREMCPICCWADSNNSTKFSPKSPDNIPQMLLKSPKKASKSIVLYAERRLELSNRSIASELASL